MSEQNPHISNEELSKMLGERLRELRWKHDLSQEIVAHRAGISLNTYHKLEKGISNPGTPANPRLFTLLGLADVFQMSLSELLDFTAE